MTKEKPNQKEQIWAISFLVPPVIFFSNLSEYFAESGTSRILIAGLLGGIGGFLGMGVYRLVKNKTVLAKIITMTVLVAFCVAVIIVSKKLLVPNSQSIE